MPLPPMGASSNAGPGSASAEHSDASGLLIGDAQPWLRKAETEEAPIWAAEIAAEPEPSEDFSSWDIGSADFLGSFVVSDPDTASMAVTPATDPDPAGPYSATAAFVQPDADQKIYQRRPVAAMSLFGPADFQPTCADGDDDVPLIDDEAEAQAQAEAEAEAEGESTEEKPVSMVDFLNVDESAWGGGGSAPSGTA